MIERILIANRGEIAARAIRTIKRMGKEAIVIYSTADKEASYLDFADSSVCIGPAKATESYLNIPAIIATSEIVGADAIFPGYGFLSENKEFVDICEHHGIKFIGPSSKVMEIMGDKSKAKNFVKSIGVPTLPGSEGVLKSVDEAKKVAKEIGYPVLLKASAGGGGKGMRVVNSESELEKLFFAAESEAYNAFGDGSLYMEKLIINPRHIEVQILGDSFGNVIHLGERDCSLQRRQQKVIEEAPATILDKEVREKIREVAVKIGKALKYEGAGTIEFLVDKEQNFYFMEMNTRLQVEHPVSEAVTGIDIVEKMIEVAEGKPLPKQEEIDFNGRLVHYLYLRLYILR